MSSKVKFKQSQPVVMIRGVISTLFIQMMKSSVSLVRSCLPSVKHNQWKYVVSNSVIVFELHLQAPLPLIPSLFRGSLDPETVGGALLDPETVGGGLLDPETVGALLDPETVGDHLDPETVGDHLDPETVGDHLDPETVGKIF
ncbi:hypothetical protein FHG87_024108 [Trinorchestia longiramus]|nr:hypothetical protein FHG87_024108 [Trinorchestia longiramus]